MTDYNAAQGGQMRPLAVRIPDDLRAQLDIIAQLTDRSVTEEIRLAIAHWIDRSKSDPEVLRRADSVRADIAREAKVKSTAIDAIFARAGTKSKGALTGRSAVVDEPTKA